MPHFLAPPKKAITCPLICHLCRQLGLAESTHVVVTIAQCIWEKGINYLIDAARLVVQQCSDTVFFVVGDGPQRQVFERQVQDLGLQTHFVFTGMRVDTELFLATADFFVLLSTWEEAFSFSLLEAMASQRAVVATRIGAIPESIEDRVTGLLVPPRNAEATASAILSLLLNDELRTSILLSPKIFAACANFSGKPCYSKAPC